VTGSSCSSATTDAPTPNAVRILVVDDTATMRILTVRILESAGYEVGATGDPREALAARPLPRRRPRPTVPTGAAGLRPNPVRSVSRP